MKTLEKMMFEDVWRWIEEDGYAVRAILEGRVDKKACWLEEELEIASNNSSD